MNEIEVEQHNQGCLLCLDHSFEACQECYSLVKGVNVAYGFHK